MKNWKYIDGAKVGNEKAISSTFHINDYGVEVGQWSWDWQGKAPDENKQKEIERKIKSYVQQINKNVPAGDNDERDAVFSQLDKFVRAQGLNKKTGNAESFDEFVKKLAKEKPELYQSLWNAGKMEALKSYYHKITGNETLGEYLTSKPKTIGNEKTGAEGFFKQLSDDVKEREKKDDEEIKLVGNETYQHKLYPDKYVIIEGKNYKIVTDGKVEKSGELTDAVLYGINQTYKKVGNGPDPKEAQRLVNLHNYQSLKDIAEDNIKRYNPGHPEYERLKRLISKYEEEIKKNSKIGNSKVGNAIADKEFNTKEELKRWCKEHGYGFYPAEGHGYTNGGWYELEDTEKKGRPYLEARVRSEVGNSIGGGVQSETVLTEAKDGSQYWVEKTSKSGQYAQYNLYYTIGQGKRHAGVFKDKEAAADAGRRIIGNSSSNEEYWKKQYIEAARKKGISEREIQEFIKKVEKEGAKGVLIPVKNVASEYEILKQDPSKMHPLYKKAYEEAMKKLAREDEEFKKRFEKEYGVKAKNEASDDKFAYVMREFDEGKLKTPDGKVVTDPAQAKAIAYSESKKTENGLARARNAIKKS